MQATFIQKVIICAVAGFAAACLIQWGKVFVEGADKALNGGYEHRTVMGKEKKKANSLPLSAPRITLLRG
jgi:hypothetical protein